MPQLRDQYDAVVIGGGPAGSTAALRAARHGLSVLLLEKEQHPRFHIGESFLPRCYTLLRELGLLEELNRIPNVPKFGASFVMGGDAEPADFWFSEGPNGEEPFAFNIERAPFDQMLLRAAREAGVEAHENAAVKSIDSLAEGDVRLTTTLGPVRARVALDSSGQSTVIGRHLGTRHTLPDLKRVAYFQHFSGVHRREGRLGGSIIIVMCEEGWFWMIPLDERRTSIGVVMTAELAKGAGVAGPRMLKWAIDRCPYVRNAMQDAIGPEENHVCADFSYTCRPYAGPGYFLVGDAATFVDPIFSTGVCLGMMSGVKAADGAVSVLRGERSAEAVRSEYRNFVEGSSSTFFGLVRRYYRHGFREMFLNGTGPVGVHHAILQGLAGHVFPRPVFATWWRLRLFEKLLDIHEHVTLVPRRPRFSLFKTAPAPWGAAARETVPFSMAGCV